MREISFMGKLIFNGKWETSVCPLGVMKSGHLSYDFAPETVGMDTGLIDCNGNPIYEGHIVKCKHGFITTMLEEAVIRNARNSYGKEVLKLDHGEYSCSYWRNYVVQFYDGSVRIKNGSDVRYIKRSYVSNHAVEIIGNIHDNPELLGGNNG